MIVNGLNLRVKRGRRNAVVRGTSVEQWGSKSTFFKVNSDLMIVVIPFWVIALGIYTECQLI